MATLKAIVKTKMRNGMYKVYIRFTHNRQFSYMRTSWMVNEKGLSDDKKDIIDPFVIQQTSILIEECYNKLNQVDTSKWSAKEVLEKRYFVFRRRSSVPSDRRYNQPYRE